MLEELKARTEHADEVKIKFLQKRHSRQANNLFGWPQINDIQLVSTRFIFNHEVNGVPMNRAFCVSDVDKLAREAVDYAEKYM